MSRGTGHCGHCAEHLGRLVFLSAPGRRYLAGWYARLAGTIEAAAIKE